MNTIAMLKVETIKVRKRFPIVLFTGVIAMLALIQTLIPFYLAWREHRPSPIAFPNVWGDMVRGPVMSVMPLFAGIVVISLVASEFVWRTSRQNVIDGLSRNQWYRAKVLITLVFCALFLVIFFGAAAAVAAFSPFTQFMRAQDVKMFGGVITALLGYAAISFFLALTVRKESGAIGLFVIWGPLETLISFLLGRAHKGWDDLVVYLPMHVITESANPRFWDPNGARAMAQMHVMAANRPEISWHANEVLAFIYIFAFMGVAYWDYRRRDL